jgi:hypothetical protein
MLRRISPLALIADKYIGQLSAPPTAHTSRVARPKPTKLLGSRKSPIAIKRIARRARLSLRLIQATFAPSNDAE